MGYRNKPETDAVTDRLFVCMAQRTHVDDRSSAVESKFYLPAGVDPSESDRFERLWAMLFDHDVDPPK
jgi:hypothetical protein